MGKFELRRWEYLLARDEENFVNVNLSPFLTLNWNRKTDTLEINFVRLKNINVEKVTKRTILVIANSLFDPIGLSCAVKILLCPRVHGF